MWRHCTRPFHVQPTPNNEGVEERHAQALRSKRYNSPKNNLSVGISNILEVFQKQTERQKHVWSPRKLLHNKM